VNVRLARTSGLVAVAVAVASAGCESGDSRRPRVATAQGTPSAAPGQPSPSATAESNYDKALRYTRCMNEHGVEMPDPVEGEPLNMGYVVREGDSQWYTQSKVFELCKHLLPETWPVKVDPKEIARERAFGECLRKHGQHVYEPDANGMIHYPTDNSNQETPEYEAAVRACRHLIDDPANDLPENR
jgi:hypothetical protein